MKNILSNKKHQNIILLIIILVGVVMSIMTGLNACGDETVFARVLFMIDNWYIGFIYLFIIILIIEIAFEKLNRLKKSIKKRKLSDSKS